MRNLLTFEILLLLTFTIPSNFAFNIYHESGGPTVKFVRQDDSSTADGIILAKPEPTTTSTTTPLPLTTTPTAPPKVPDCSGSCEFRNSAAYQNLISCDGACVCATRPGVMDGSSWEVIWNGTICTISESGPCGRGEHGMVMACQPGLKCIQKRCREPSRVGNLELGWACDDSWDCQTGLACVSDENKFPIHKTCRVLPRSLFRIW